MACIFALERALEIEGECFQGALRQVIIKADSSYLVCGMTDCYSSENRIGCESSGREIMNTALFRRLEQLVYDLKTVNVEVLFWHVPRV